MLRSCLVTLCACCILSGIRPVWGQEPAPVAEKEAASAATNPQAPTTPADLLPTPPSELTLHYGGELGNDINLQEEINVNLIDLDALRIRLREDVADQQFNLSLQECILIALDENMDIQISEIEPLKSDESIYAAKGEFDPFLRGSAIYNRSNESQSQEVVAFGGIASVQSFDTVTSATLAGKLHLGTQYSFSWDMDKSKSTFSEFIEEFRGTLTMQLTQPVLRGFGNKYNKVRIDIARNSRIATAAQLRLTVLNTVADVIKAYWDLVGAMENLKVQSEALDNAERLLKVNETRREIGTAADIEVLQAKAGVATRQSQYITARQNISDASNNLKNLLNLRDGERFSKALIIPIDRPNPRDAAEFDTAAYEARVSASIDTALAKRPELTIRQMAIDNAALEEYRTRKDMMPQLDLVYQYTSGGRDNTFTEAVTGIRERQDYAYSYGVQATIPIMNRTARGNYQRARLARRQAELTLDQVRQQLMLNVNLAASRVASNAILVESNKQATRLQIANVAAEEKRLQLGVTTSWQVLQIQQDLTTAQVQELISSIEYEKSLVELQLAEGTILENLNIEVKEAELEDAPVSYIDSVRPRWK